MREEFKENSLCSDAMLWLLLTLACWEAGIAIFVLCTAGWTCLCLEYYLHMSIFFL